MNSLKATKVRHLYLAQSPLQILNAFEARERDGDGLQHDLILLEKENAYHNRLVENTLRFLKWRPLHRLPCRTSTLGKLWNWMVLRHWISRLQPVARVHVGEYALGMMVAAANLCTGAEFHLVDDGTSSLSFSDFRYRGVRDARYPTKGANRLLKFDPDLPPALTFFSIYDLEIHPPDRLERNRLGFVRRSIEFDDAGPVLFVGSNLPDNEEMSYPRFFELMRGIRAHFGPRPIRYYAHRTEHMHLKESVFAELRIEIVLGELPFEMNMLQGGQKPSFVAGFYSTVLDTLRLSGVAPDGRLISFHVASEEIRTPIEKVMAATCYANYRCSPGMVVVTDYAPAAGAGQPIP